MTKKSVAAHKRKVAAARKRGDFPKIEVCCLLRFCTLCGNLNQVRRKENKKLYDRHHCPKHCTRERQRSKIVQTLLASDGVRFDQPHKS